MHPAAFLALLTIVMLMLAAVRLELNFRRVAEPGPGEAPRGPARQSSGGRPELRASPAGGYCQPPLPGAALPAR